MATSLYYDIYKNTFIYNTTGKTLIIEDYLNIAYKEYKEVEWNIGYWDNSTLAFVAIDLTAYSVTAWASAVDYDYSTLTPPMIAVADANIDDTNAATGKIVVGYDADNPDFLAGVNGQTNGSRACVIDLIGTNASTKSVFIATPGSKVIARMLVAPGSDPSGPSATLYYTKVETDGLVSGKLSDINTLTEKATALVDADQVAIADSEASNASKKSLWSTIKSTLKTYFDTLYSTVSHAARHTNGSDDIQNATSGQKGLMTSTYASKLDGIEAAADVTDATNVAAAGALMAPATPAQGDVLYYNGTNWVVLTAGTNGYYLKTQGASANPVWAAVSASGITTPDTPVQGDILYFNGTNWKCLVAGTSGHFLKTNGASANPSWASAAGGGDVLGPATNSADYVPQWNGANSKTLKNGYAVAGASGIASLDANTKVVQDPANATATATASKIPIADGSAKLDTWITDASTTAKGKVELAIASEVTTGTSESLAITPDSFAGSNFGKRTVSIEVFGSTTNVAIGDGTKFLRIPASLDGYNLVAVAACVYTAGTTNTTDIQIRNKTDSQDMLSTKITIDSTETDSSTAATAAVINTSYDDVATGDVIAIDVDATSTTAAKGLLVELTFQLP